ncbi:anhydro-N-acetylmuramic acid kinase [Halovulum dunhuangense]|uniref:Anhydro-N-acetylmuramic acid kinase n=2 Tax=Halovulum dunhuangense TaxID=1505036 RepID=A0A849L3G2_9RHOB|nr:anhydro-N-acetylmuramic acid kinase [Halovulum dunhuangense]
MTGEPIWALGMMSGTSMDGIDAAALLTDGEGIQGFGPKRFAPYEPAERDLLRRAQGLWQGADPLLREVDATLVAAHEALAGYFPTTALIGFHGQTLAHDPAGFRTHQAGDGAALAKSLGKPVVWDFRSADIASGGEGAPLVPFFHHACARMLGMDQVVAFLNLGGVGNVTWVDPLVTRPETPGALCAFDTGPGNALIDDLMETRGVGAMDEGGSAALAGRPDEALIAKVLEDPYFARPAPKSLDRNHFAWVLERVAHMDLADAAATLTALSAECVAASVRHMPEPPSRWLVCGGGRKNRALMAALTARSNAEVVPVEAVSLDGDFLEAQAFAYLAVRVMRGLPTSAPGTTGARLPVSGGRIHRPAPVPGDPLAAVRRVF